MSKIAQCSTSVEEPPTTGSGSWRMRTKLWVPAGAFDQEMVGDGLVCPAAHVNLAGILLPSAKSATLILSMGGGPCFFAPLSCAFMRAADASNVAAMAHFVEIIGVLLRMKSARPCQRSRTAFLASSAALGNVYPA